MEGKVEDKYINFPIHFLKGFLVGSMGLREDKKYIKSLENAAYYAAYIKAAASSFGDYAERMNSAMTWLGVDPGLWGDDAYIAGRRLANQVDQLSNGGKPPMTGLKVSVLQRFMYEHVSDRQVVTLLAYLALKSIIGNKPYAKTTNQMMVSRMAGYTTLVDQHVLKQFDSEVWNIYTRRKLDRIKNDLIDGWGMAYYGSHTKGFYVSFKMRLEDLVYQVEKKRKKYKDEDRQNKKNEAIKKAKDKLSRETS